MTDDQLVSLLKKGNARGLSSLYDRYVGALYRFFYWQTNARREVAEDLTQETFLEVAKSIHTFKGVSSFKNWLYVIAKNRLATFLRGLYDLPTKPLFDYLAQSEDSIDPVLQKQKINQLTKLLATLSKIERNVLVLRYLHNYSVAETATKLHLSASNVKVIAYRSIKKLREKSL